LDLLQILVLALVQGFTEFLPISSSAHLVLVPYVTGWGDQGLAYDVAAHLGTLLAVAGYYRRHLLLMAYDWLQCVAGAPQTEHSHFAWLLLWATIPVGLAGLAGHDIAAHLFRNPLIIASTTVIFGLFLWYADVNGRRLRDYGSIGIRVALLIGLAQVLALVPGTSRSGVTITAGLMCGLTRQAAARFSFLLSVPVIFLAGCLEAWELVDSGVPVSWLWLFLVTLLSCVSAYVCIYYFLRLLDRIGMGPFVIYRLVLGTVLFAVFI